MGARNGFEAMAHRLLQSFDLSERRFGWMSELDGFGIEPFHEDRGSRTGGRSR